MGADIGSLIYHAPITINGNAQFAAMAESENWSGNGTSEDPYIIEGLEISGITGMYCLWIGNTDVHFVVRNCWFHHASPVGGAGVHLESLRNALVENCTSERNGGYGLEARNSQNVTMRNNTCHYSPIGIYYSICYSVLYPSVSYILNNSVDNGTAYGLSIYATNYAVVSGNQVRDFSQIGIVVSAQSGGMMSNNTISRCGSGIDLAHNVNGALVADNTVMNSTLGIHINLSNDCKVVRNRVENSTGYGIYLTGTSARNRICDNEFLFNNGLNKQGYDDVGTNFFNRSGSGNFWSDWTSPDDDSNGIVDVPYGIDGGRGVQDYYPLTTPGVPIPEFGAMPLVLVLFAVFVAWGARRARRY